MRKERIEFFEEEEKYIQNINLGKLYRLIKKAVIKQDKKLLKYENLISLGAENNGKRLKRTELVDLLNGIYRIWWHKWVLPKSETDSYQKDLIKRYIDAGIFDPDSDKRLKSIYEIIDEWNYKGLFEDACRFQDSYFLVIDTNFFTAEREKMAFRYYDTKIYLNIKLENRVELAKRFIDKAMKEGFPLTFKFALYDERTDNVVIYNKFENTKATAKFIDEIKKEHPELFEGCKVKNPLLATYHGYMGFGEESYYGSYNSVRTDILMLTYLELLEEYKKDKKSLTDENIKRKFRKNCWREQVDPNCFYKNKDRKIWDPEAEY